ncbi:MAG: T9SS type A sorting domain-containing protein [Chitinivibrionales bacterium]|nr:T9SS type A sorting domain-containing protein [Chitinivibrionales bacterium]
MKKAILFTNAICCFFVGAHAIGMQHGLFRSQSTQGAPWQGTATIVNEQYHITVHADYLDVELAWTIEVGGNEPDSFKNALEIVGNLNLEDKSVVVGMVTWYKDMILKAKLKTNDVAREQYENVVQRSSDVPPPPRDPVLLEWIWDDNYDISIFPVTFGQTRRVRIRYLIPAYCSNGVNKIAYPHAFTDHAQVLIRKGPGVDSYRVETPSAQNIFENRLYESLSGADYNFEAHGLRHEKRISHIIPILAQAHEGSLFYEGDFSTSKFSGQMLHVTTMSGQEALKKSIIGHDYVILWRWNHPQILEKYARQIVEQSTLLQEFLENLDAAHMRAALIIDKEGGERITFSLDTKGGREYNRMIAWLTELSRREIVDPPMRDTPRTQDIPFDIQQAFQEFQNALKAAQELFDTQRTSLKHLLILCAGPRLVTSSIADQTVEWDGQIDVSMLESSVFSNGSPAPDPGLSTHRAYWPGVNMKQFLHTHRADIQVFAMVGNGVDTNRIAVIAESEGSSYCQPVGCRQMHLYSNRPMNNQIQWSVYRGDDLIAEYTETPQIVPMDDGMQYARLIGSSPHLTPLAPVMPSSMASTLGFVDEKYSLVALEEDALPPSVVRRLRDNGVPLLNSADIFPAADQRADIPVAEWLYVNPPEPMTEYVCGLNREIIPVPLGAPVMWAPEDVDIFVVPDMQPAPARIAPPQAPIMYAVDPEAYVDYESALFAAPPAAHVQTAGGFECFIINSSLVIESGALSSGTKTDLQIVLYDLSGRVVRRWSFAASSSRNRLIVPLENTVLGRGTYICRITGADKPMSRRFVTR